MNGPSERQGGIDLQTRASTWSTPKARNYKRAAGSRNTEDLNTMSRNWQTPRAVAAGSDYQKSGELVPNLHLQARTWPTPTSNNKTKPNAGTGEALEYLSRQQWPTPSASQYGSNQGGSGGREGQPNRPSLQKMARGLRVQEETGEESTPLSTLRLNPRFVEWLMGLPVNWTHPFEPIDYAHWEMLYRRLLRRSLG